MTCNRVHLESVSPLITSSTQYPRERYFILLLNSSCSHQTRMFLPGDPAAQIWDRGSAAAAPAGRPQAENEKQVALPPAPESQLVAVTHGHWESHGGATARLAHRCLASAASSHSAGL
ncbi:hypothetical protein AAFF_G00072050 [Aldrovandia affinis]|uniref:Uncharacterized protein n=1 Tax=Aldrovandia affinis TaxID=143900 RepID=A0AAD7S142_9TELE|nr:hypothetical protein AAFF_G00072050 [Aldrovandia affinis]